MTYQEMLSRVFSLDPYYKNGDRVRIFTYASIMHSFNLLSIEKCPEYAATTDIKLTVYKHAELVERVSNHAS